MLDFYKGNGEFDFDEYFKISDMEEVSEEMVEKAVQFLNAQIVSTIVHLGNKPPFSVTGPMISEDDLFLSTSLIHTV